MKATPIASNLEAMRAAAKAKAQEVAAPAAPAPAAVPTKATKAAPILKQLNVRLTPEAHARVKAAAHAARMSDQELLERWAMSLPEPEAPKLPF